MIQIRSILEYRIPYVWELCIWAEKIKKMGIVREAWDVISPERLNKAFCLLCLKEENPTAFLAGNAECSS
jgi:hypothetical protein